MDYVVCLAFDARREFVTLIEKRRPAWQAGRLNGPGGKMEAGETPAQAAEREFAEETGASIPAEKWRHFAMLMCGDGDNVHFLTACRNFNTRTVTDEPVAPYNVAGILAGDLPVIDNLRWLVPMALDPTHKFAALSWDGNNEESI